MACVIGTGGTTIMIVLRGIVHIGPEGIMRGFAGTIESIITG